MNLMLRNEHMDYVKYFKNKRAEFAANRFSKKEAVAFCKRLQKLGAKVDILVDDEVMDAGDRCDEIYADTMIVTLPKAAVKRLGIVAELWQAMPDEISADCYSAKEKPVNWRKDKKVLLWWD